MFTITYVIKHNTYKHITSPNLGRCPPPVWAPTPSSANARTGRLHLRAVSASGII